MNIYQDPYLYNLEKSEIPTSQLVSKWKENLEQAALVIHENFGRTSVHIEKQEDADKYITWTRENNKDISVDSYFEYKNMV